MAIQAAWERAREEYSRRGYLDAKIDPAASYDDHAHTVAYTVSLVEGPQYHFGSMVLTGLSTTGEARLREAWPIPQGAVFDKAQYETFLTNLQTHRDQVFKDLPLHYDTVGHWLQTDQGKQTVDVLLDFQ
jgi:outer membrane protein assembly factor BamA